MHSEEFSRKVRESRSTKEELLTWRKNVLAKDRYDLAEILEQELHQRFPSWDEPKSTRSGSTAAKSLLQSVEEVFPTGKDAYLWLIECFRTHKPGLLESQDQWRGKAFKGDKRFYFARTPTDLFPDRSDLAKKAGNYSKISGGWFASLNENHATKFKILVRLSYVCGLNYPTDWDFQVIGASDALLEQQRMKIAVDKILAEIESLDEL
jgi:hypothetical protein